LALSGVDLLTMNVRALKTCEWIERKDQYSFSIEGA